MSEPRSPSRAARRARQGKRPEPVETDARYQAFAARAKLTREDIAEIKKVRIT